VTDRFGEVRNEARLIELSRSRTARLKQAQVHLRLLCECGEEGPPCLSPPAAGRTMLDVEHWHQVDGIWLPGRGRRQAHPRRGPGAARRRDPDAIVDLGVDAAGWHRRIVREEASSAGFQWCEVPVYFRCARGHLAVLR
jgi:hypothetical protein